MITYISNYKPIGPGRKNGAVGIENLDRLLQDLRFTPKPHPDIFIPNEPETVFEGVKTFQNLGF